MTEPSRDLGGRDRLPFWQTDAQRNARARDEEMGLVEGRMWVCLSLTDCSAESLGKTLANLTEIGHRLDVPDFHLISDVENSQVKVFGNGANFMQFEDLLTFGTAGKLNLVFSCPDLSGMDQGVLAEVLSNITLVE